jgi:hypothetical protein
MKGQENILGRICQKETHNKEELGRDGVYVKSK